MRKLLTTFLCIAVLGGLGYVAHVVLQSTRGADTKAQTALAAGATQNQNNIVVTEDEIPAPQLSAPVKSSPKEARPSNTTPKPTRNEKTPAPGFSAPVSSSPDDATPANATPKPPRAQSAGEKEYRNEHYRFDLFYPETLKVTEYDEGSGARTITFEDPDTAYGFQVFIKPYGQRQVNTEVFKIDESVFKIDEPSGVMKEPKPIVIAGAQGNEFFGHNDQMEDTREIWFVHGGYLFEVYTYKPLDSWFAGIMKTWKFL